MLKAAVTMQYRPMSFRQLLLAGLGDFMEPGESSRPASTVITSASAILIQELFCMDEITDPVLNNFSLPHGAQVCARLFQGSHHLFDRKHCWIIVHGVYFLGAAKAIFNALHSVQPFQGFLADVVSCNCKDRLCFCSLSVKKKRCALRT